MVYFVCFIMFVETLHRKCVFHFKQWSCMRASGDGSGRFWICTTSLAQCESSEEPPPQTQRLALVKRTCSGRINWNFWCVKHERQHVIFALKWSVWSVFLKELEWDDNLLCGEHQHVLCLYVCYKCVHLIRTLIAHICWRHLFHLFIQFI